MTFDLQKILESKRRFRTELAARPIAEKLALLDQLRESALANHRSRSAMSAKSPSTVRETAPPYPDKQLVGSLGFRHGDATQPVRRPAVLVHVCNDVGGWGAGFVLAISKRWKAPEREYRAAFATASKPQLGEVQIVEVEPDCWVANMIAQPGIGRGRDGEIPLRYDAVRTGLTKVAEFARAHGATAHMPRIGCGLAGGKWEEIEPIIRDTLLAAGVDVTVYDFA